MKSAREMVSPAVTAAQTRLVTTPHDLVSPSTLRNVAVTTTPLEYVSPLVRRQRGIASPQVLQPRVQENNDDAERRERRRSTVRDLHIQQLCSPGTPSSSDKRTDPLNGLSTTQLTEHYANCIKLSAENKINSKNAFRLHLIDYMSELIAKKEMTNFQVASSTLDASAKIYAGRVDAIHTETYKMLSGLGCGADKNDNDNDDGNEEDGDEQEGVKRKKKVRRGKTIETNLKNIGLNKFDLEFQVDPFFQKMSASFDEGGTGGLLLTQLRCFDSMSQLAFDSSTVISQGGTERSTDDVNDASVDLRGMQSVYAGVKLDTLQVCPTFAQFEFSNWNQAGEQDSIMSQLNKSASGRHAFDLDAEPEPILDDPGDDDGGYEALDDDNDHGDGGSEAGSMMMGEGAEARLVENTLDSIRNGTVGTLMQVLAAEPSEYSYFSANLLETWAGPDHWKLRPRSKGEVLAAASGEGTATEGDKKPRGKKEPFRVDFKEEVDVDSHLKKTRAATTVTKATLVKYSKSQTTLPKDLHYDGKNLFTLTLRPRLMVKRQESVTDVDDGVETYNYNNANDVENFCPCPELGLADDGDDDDDGGGMEMTQGAGDFCLSQDMTQAGMTAGDSLLSHSVFTGDNLVSQPRKVAKLNIAYAKIAKKIDMKRLKTSMWQLLTKPCVEDKTAQENCGGEEEGRKSMGGSMVGRHSFSAVVRDLHAVLPKQSANNLSVHIAFGCLLHLANEKMLSLQSNDTLTDLLITQ